MTNEGIKSTCDTLYDLIKISEDKLAIIRKNCKHEKTIEVNYSYRPGSIALAYVCEYCKQFIRYK